jgi:hypothetical protein
MDKSVHLGYALVHCARALEAGRQDNVYAQIDAGVYMLQAVAACRAHNCYQVCAPLAGWDKPSSTAKPHEPIPAELKPLLQECYAMYNLLLPHALQPASHAALAPSRGLRAAPEQVAGVHMCVWLSDLPLRTLLAVPSHV